MSTNENDAREALVRIARIASAACGGNESADDVETYRGGYRSGDGGQMPVIVCVPKRLPERLLLKSAQVAIHVNPVNAPLTQLAASRTLALPSSPLFIAAVTSKYWGTEPRTFTVGFMETTPADLRARILSHMNAWSRTTGVRFVETATEPQVRISRDGSGYWSYLGTDILLIPKNQPTMNLQDFSMSTPESEYRRVVRHETGHTLGFPHEHMRQALVSRIDPQKAYDYFLRTQGWDKETVDQQVLTSLDERSLLKTPPDQTSIMCYQLPGLITRDGRPIVGGLDINATDFAFAGQLYPKAGPVSAAVDADTWPEEDDVNIQLSGLGAM